MNAKDAPGLTAALLDRTSFQVGHRAYQQFTKALDEPPADNVRLRRLLNSRAPWER